MPKPAQDSAPTANDLSSRVAHAREHTAARIGDAATLAELDGVRRESVGKSGSLADVRRRIGALTGNDERRRVGAELAAATQRLNEALEAREQELLDAAPALDAPFDVTLPASPVPLGGLHPSVQMMYDLNDAFTALNFQVYAGPEISSEHYEFDALNFRPDHPARESMDTYWLRSRRGAADSGLGAAHARHSAADSRLCLRPHLTGASIRYLLEHGGPARIVYPGRVYRNESTDARHERAFFQYEVLVVDRDIPLTAGRSLVDTILRTVFGRPVQTRMRTGYFPFVEPGFEIDMKCTMCGGAGCRTCHQVGWLEVMPGGAPHPDVLRAGGLDPAEWTGFYVNIGLDRLVMMRYGIDDVRLMHSADLRYLEQFR